MTSNTKRDRLVESAAILFHKFGMISTSLADIAKHAEIPIGNVYYYFKTKDELAMAALARRSQSLEEIYDHIEASVEDPRQRLIELLRFFDKVKDEYARHGCPIYRLVIDGGEMDGDSVAHAAAGIYESFLEWTESQFRNLGYTDQARNYAVTLLAGIQGGAVMANAFKKPQMLLDEIDRLIAWLESLPNRRIFLGKGGHLRPQQDVA